MFQLPRFENHPQWISQQSRLMIGGWLYPVEVHIEGVVLAHAVYCSTVCENDGQEHVFFYRCHFMIKVDSAVMLGLLHGVCDHEHGFISCRIKVTYIYIQSGTSRCSHVRQWQIGILPHPCTRFVHINAFWNLGFLVLVCLLTWLCIYSQQPFDSNLSSALWVAYIDIYIYYIYKYTVYTLYLST